MTGTLQNTASEKAVVAVKSKSPSLPDGWGRFSCGNCAHHREAASGHGRCTSFKCGCDAHNNDECDEFVDSNIIKECNPRVYTFYLYDEDDHDVFDSLYCCSHLEKVDTVLQMFRTPEHPHIALYHRTTEEQIPTTDIFTNYLFEHNVPKSKIPAILSDIYDAFLWAATDGEDTDETFMDIAGRTMGRIISSQIS